MINASNDMLVVRKTCVAVFAIMLFCCISIAQDKNILHIKPHPYLFFTSERIQHLKERMKNDTMMNRVWNEMKSRADRPGGTGQRRGNIEELSFVYRMTGDKKYADAVKKSLLEMINTVMPCNRDKLLYLPG